VKSKASVQRRIDEISSKLAAIEDGGRAALRAELEAAQDDMDRLQAAERDRAAQARAAEAERLTVAARAAAGRVEAAIDELGTAFGAFLESCTALASARDIRDSARWPHHQLVSATATTRILERLGDFGCKLQGYENGSSRSLVTRFDK
jgi:chromosome segregation ATPase